MRDRTHELAALDPALARRFTVVRRHHGGEGWSAAVRPVGASGESLQLLKVLADAVPPREASVLASLRHPSIPAVHEVGHTADGRAYLVRDYLAGDIVEQDAPMPADAVRELAVQLLSVLAFVHWRGVLHLDVKPANVLRSPPADAPRYALLDFGTAARPGDGAGGGTPFFAAPERWLGLAPTPRSDLYSLGATIAVLLGGMPSAPELAAWRRHFPRRPLLAAVGRDRNALPAPFDRWLPRLLARQPHRRFGDAEEALDELVGGSGRPALGVLRPDPIACYAPALDAVLARAGARRDVVVRGGDADDRRAVAVHTATVLTGARAVVHRDATSVVRRGGEAAVELELGQIDAGAVAAHLRASVGLQPAEPAAQALWSVGARTPAALGAALSRLVEAGSIAPDGARWSWPAAAAGRVDLAAPPILAGTPAALRRAAQQGQVEAAFAAYRRELPGLDAPGERRLRAALAEGLTRGGEPARALPLVHDLPLLEARARLDLGQVRAADAILAVHPPREGGSAARRLLAASAAELRGDWQRALDLLDGVRTRRVEAAVLRGLVLTRAGDAARAVGVLQAALARIDERRPFLRAAALTNLAEAERDGGDGAAAQRHHAAALAELRRLGHVRGCAVAHSNLGVLAKDRGELDEARGHLRRALALYRHVGDVAGVARADANLGIVSLAAGRPEVGVRRMRRAARRLQSVGCDGPLPLVYAHLAAAHAALGEVSRARRWLARLGGDADGRVRRLAAEVEQRLARMGTDEGRERERGSEMTVPATVFQTFTAINRRLAAAGDPRAALEFLLDAAVTLLGGRLAHLLLAEDGGLRVVLSRGTGSGGADAFSRTLANRAMQSQRALSGDDLVGDASLSEMTSVRNLEQRSALCVPFTTAGGGGALYVEHPTRGKAFAAVHKEWLEVLADQASIAVAAGVVSPERGATRGAARREEAVPPPAPEPGGRGATPRDPVAEMLGDSPPMRALRRQIAVLADADLPILVLGETGTGKELAARALHEQGERRRGPFLSENCSAIPTELMESELFGHRKGAFTGADRDRAGLLELAAGGTLFLDEVGDMPLTLQAKLLRVLQENVARRVGDHAPIALDFRLVAATHRDLPAMIAAGEFREDLYFRLAAAELRVPALRQRGDDVLLLADAFLDRLNRQQDRAVVLADTARAQLIEHGWPGNVRELAHVIERAFLFATGDRIEAVELQTIAVPDGAGRSWPVMPLAEAEARTIDAVLRHTDGDKTKAAKLLGISRTALYQKLKRRARAAE